MFNQERKEIIIPYPTTHPLSRHLKIVKGHPKDTFENDVLFYIIETVSRYIICRTLCQMKMWHALFKNQKKKKLFLSCTVFLLTCNTGLYLPFNIVLPWAQGHSQGECRTSQPVLQLHTWGKDILTQISSCLCLGPCLVWAVVVTEHDWGSGQLRNCPGSQRGGEKQSHIWVEAPGPSMCSINYPIEPHLENTNSQIKLLSTSRWPLQGIKPQAWSPIQSVKSWATPLVTHPWNQPWR